MVIGHITAVIVLTGNTTMGIGHTVRKRTKGCDKGGCRDKGGCCNNGGIQPYKKAVSEQRERLVGGKIQPFKKAVSEQRRGKPASLL